MRLADELFEPNGVAVACPLQRYSPRVCSLVASTTALLAAVVLVTASQGGGGGHVADTQAASDLEQLQLGTMHPDDQNSPFHYDLPGWVAPGDEFDYSTISKADMINSIDSSMTAGLPRDVFMTQLQKELPDDVSAACDYSVDPCLNFYEFACGTWIKDTEIPPHDGKVLKSWSLTEKKVKQELRAIFEEPFYNQPEFQRLSDWYKSCIDTAQVDEVGLSDLSRVLAHVDSAVDEKSLADALTYLVVLNLQSLFSFKVNLPTGQHDKNSLYLKPSGLTMANPAIYIRQDSQNALLVEDLRAHFTRINQLTGLSSAAAATAGDLDMHT